MLSLLAILLVVRSRSGPQLIYRYPPNAQRSDPHKQALDDSSDSDSDGDINGIASLRRKHKAKASQGSAQTASKIESENVDSADYLGFSEDSLEKLLAPGLWSDRKKFEVCIDGLTFVGHPAHAHEDGKWTRKEAKPPHGIDHVSTADVDDRYGDYTNYGITITEPLSPARTARDFQHVPESLNSQLERSLGTSVNSASSASTTRAEPLIMFNVVFAFDSSGDQVIGDTYRHVVKKLSKALHHCQKQSGYVGLETRRLLSVYARAKQERLSSAVLQQQAVETSELAWTLKEVYDKISGGEIAGVRLNGQAISLHVPPRQTESEQTTDLDPSVGLLLLEDKGVLLRELSHPDASPLEHFIREHTPTKPLQKLATRIGMSVEEVLYLARHLIKWRKARTIMPLHPRNSYVVSLSAAADRLQDYMNDYARRFPGLPSLPQMLKFLSTGKPIRYGLLVPSRDHRAPYMDILTYLVRHGFVVQLKTCAWLRRISRRRKRQASPNRKEETINQNRMPLSVASLLSPQLRAVDDDVASVSSERTAIPLGSKPAVPSPSISATRAPDRENDDEGLDDPWNIILDPFEPSDEDRVYLENLREAVEDDELRERLPSLFGYFNGKEALEGIAAREGLKRSMVERWLDLLVREGLVTTVKYT